MPRQDDDDCCDDRHGHVGHARLKRHLHDDADDIDNDKEEDIDDDDDYVISDSSRIRECGIAAATSSGTKMADSAEVEIGKLKKMKEDCGLSSDDIKMAESMESKSIFPGLSIFFLKHNFCVKPYVPREPEGTEVIVGSMNMGYISDTARNRIHNLFRPKREPIPLGHSAFCFLMFVFLIPHFINTVNAAN